MINVARCCPGKSMESVRRGSPPPPTPTSSDEKRFIYVSILHGHDTDFRCLKSSDACL